MYFLRNVISSRPIEILFRLIAVEFIHEYVVCVRWYVRLLSKASIQTSYYNYTTRHTLFTLLTSSECTVRSLNDPSGAATDGAYDKIASLVF